MSEQKQPLAYIRIRRLADNTEVHKIPVYSLNKNHLDKVMLGLSMKTNLEQFWIDDGETDEAEGKGDE